MSAPGQTEVAKPDMWRVPQHRWREIPGIPLPPSSPYRADLVRVWVLAVLTLLVIALGGLNRTVHYQYVYLNQGYGIGYGHGKSIHYILEWLVWLKGHGDPVSPTLKVAAKDCDIGFHKTSGDPYMVLRYWKPSGKHSMQYDFFSGDDKLEINVNMKKRSPFLACHIKFYLKPEMEVHFGEAKIGSLGAEMSSVYSDLELRVKRKFEVKSIFAMMHLKQIDSPQIVLQIKDGSVDLDWRKKSLTSSWAAIDPEKEWWIQRPNEFNMGQDKGTPAVTIKAQRAPVSIRSVDTLDVHLLDRAADYAKVSGVTIEPPEGPSFPANQVLCQGVHVICKSNSLVEEDPDSDNPYRHFEGIVKLYASAGDTKRRAIAVDADESPVYLVAADKATQKKQNRAGQSVGLSVKVGVKQETPHLMPHSLDYIKKTKKYQKEADKSPWMISMNVLGPSLPAGTWRFYSTTAYLAFSQEWLTLLSAGMLSPETYRLTIHFAGMKDDWPPAMAHKDDMTLPIPKGNLKGSEKKDTNSTEEGKEEAAASRRLDFPSSLSDTESLDDYFQGLLNDELLMGLEADSCSWREGSCPRRLKDEKDEDKDKEEKKPAVIPGTPPKVNDRIFFLMYQHMNVTFWMPVVWAPEIRNTEVGTIKIGQMWRYTMLHNVVEKQPVMLGSMWMFLAASFLNVLAALMIAGTALALIKLKAVPFLLDTMRESALETTASMRLRKTTGTVVGFRIQTSLVEYPRYGLMLRFSKRPKHKGIKQYKINLRGTGSRKALATNAEQAQTNGENGSAGTLVMIQDNMESTASNMDSTLAIEHGEQEVLPEHRFEFIIKASCIKAPKEYPSRMEYLITVAPAGPLPEEPMHQAMISGHCYCAQVSCLATGGKAMEASQWSSEVRIRGSKALADYPFLLMKTFAPAKVVPFEVFMERLTEPYRDALAIKADSIAVHMSELWYENAYEETDTWNVDIYHVNTDKEHEKAESLKGEAQSMVSTGALPEPSRMTPREGVMGFTLKLPCTILEKLTHLQIADDDIQLEVVSSQQGNALLKATITWDELQQKYNPSLSEVFVSLTNEDDEDVAGIHLQYSFCNSAMEHDVAAAAGLLGPGTTNGDGYTLMDERTSHPFVGDVPGIVLRQGMDEEIKWDPACVIPPCSPSSTVTVYIVDTAGQRKTLGKAEVSIGSLWWKVDSDSLKVGSFIVTCRYEIECVAEGLHNHSNWFQIRRSLLVSDLELAFASFCKLNDLEMQSIDDVMEEHGVVTTTIDGFASPGVRLAMPFETNENDVVQAPGALLVSVRDVMLQDHQEVDAVAGGGESPPKLSPRGAANGNSAKPALEDTKSNTRLLSEGGDADEDAGNFGWTRFTCKSMKLDVVDNLYFRKPTELSWQPDFLLENGISYSGIVQGAILQFADQTKVDKIAQGFAKTLPAKYQSQALDLIDILGHWTAVRAPILITTITFFIGQLIFFFLSPLGILGFMIWKDLCFSELPVHDVHINYYLLSDAVFPDTAIAASQSFSFATVFTLFICLLYMGVCVFVVFFSNFMKTVSASLTYKLDNIAVTLSAISFALLLIFLFVTCLWFVLGALIDPSRLMPYAVMVGSVSAVVKGLLGSLSDTKEFIEKLITDQLDMLLGIVLDLSMGLMDIPADDNGEEDEETLKKKAKLEEEHGRLVSADLQAFSSVTNKKAPTLPELEPPADFEEEPKGSGSEQQNLRKVKKIYKFFVDQIPLGEEIEELLDNPSKFAETTVHVRRVLLKSLLGDYQSKDFAEHGLDQSKAVSIFMQIFKEEGQNVLINNRDGGGGGYLVRILQRWLDKKRIKEIINDFYSVDVIDYIDAQLRMLLNENLKESKMSLVLSMAESRSVGGTETWDFRNVVQFFQSAQIFPERTSAQHFKKRADYVKRSLHLAGIEKFPLYQLESVTKLLLKEKVWFAGFENIVKLCGLTRDETEAVELRLWNAFNIASERTGLLDVDRAASTLLSATGGLWKAGTVALLRKLKLGGDLGCQNLGKESDEQDRIAGDWQKYKPAWPPAMETHWNKATRAEKGGFLQKGQVLSLVQEAVFLTDPQGLTISGKVRIDELLLPIPGFASWRILPSGEDYEDAENFFNEQKKQPGFPKAVQLPLLYHEEERDVWVPIRGIWSELFTELLASCGMRFESSIGRFFFSISGNVLELGVKEHKYEVDDEIFDYGPPDGAKKTQYFSIRAFAAILEQTVGTLKFLSLDGFRFFLEKASITVSEQFSKAMFDVCPEATFMKKKCPGLVDFRELAMLIPFTFSSGLWREALLVLLNDFLRLRLPKQLVLELFDKYDKDFSGFLNPLETFDLLKNIPRLGLNFTMFKQLINDLGFTGVSEMQLRKSFMMIDVDQSGLINLDKFVGGLNVIMLELIPKMILTKIGLSIENIVKILVGAVVVLLTVFAFILLAMAAFTPPGAAASAIQSTLGAGSAMVVQGEGKPKDLSRLTDAVKEMIDMVMDIPKSQRRKMEGK